MAANPTAPTPIPALDTAGGLIEPATTVNQQQSNFAKLWNYLAYLLGGSGTRTEAFNTISAGGGTVGAALNVNGTISAAGGIGSNEYVFAPTVIGQQSLQAGPHANAGVAIYHREDFGVYWLFYGASGALRCWFSGTGDRWSVDTLGNFRATGDVSCNSDERLKTNITTIAADVARKALLASRGVSYKRIDSGKPGSGVIGQEAREVVPELVSENEDGILAVNYQGYVPYLIEGYHAHDDEIVALRKEVQELRDALTSGRLQ